MASEKGGLLARSDFPLYVVKSLDERHFLVAGGGGAAKTGVANAVVSSILKQQVILHFPYVFLVITTWHITVTAMG